jgi:hypothetical protein
LFNFHILRFSPFQGYLKTKKIQKQATGNRVRSKPLEYHDDHYTLFHKVNTNVFLPNGKIGDLSNQHMPPGTLPQALNMQISIDQKDNITLTWTNHLEYIASYDNSRLGIIAMYNHRSFRPRLIEGAPQPERSKKQFSTWTVKRQRLFIFMYFSFHRKKLPIQMIRISN